MPSTYHHQNIEPKWQKKWDDDEIYHATDKSGREKFFALIEFPYPSGEGLHVGHPRSYTAMDIISRQQRMAGKNVLYPIGFDAFGLPTENFAIKKKIHPKIVTKNNIENFRRQLKSFGYSFDWSREINTTDPEYYKWTQWIFLKFFEHRLAYKATIPINWCVSCKIGLANEEVINGRCERCGGEVEKRNKEQWMLKITAYAEKLLNDLKEVDYLDRIKTQQANWIGKSSGAEINFPIKAFDKILLATTNEHKVKRIKKLFNQIAPSIEILSPTEAGLTKIDVVEGSDLFENAELKVKAYQSKTSLPIIGIDSGLFIDGAEIDPVQVKRNALNGANEKNLTQPEIADLILKYYQKIIAEKGGEVEAYWKDVFAIIYPNGEKIITESIREITLTDKIVGEVDIYVPLRSLYRNKATGKYDAEQTEEEEILELTPIINALRNLLPQLKVFTTRPDTIFGATYMVIAPEHELVNNFRDKITNWSEVENYVNAAQKKSDQDRADESKEKTGVELKGIKAINPASQEKIPIFIADYVLLNYGTGAIMAVPAHDERDFAFAKKFNLLIKQVVAPYFYADTGSDAIRLDKPTQKRQTVYCLLKHHTENKYLCLDWVKFNWHSGIIGGIEAGEDVVAAGIREIQEETGYKNIKLIREIPNEVHNYFFARHKDINNYAIGHNLLFQLVDDQYEEPKPEDIKNHQTVWIAGDQMSSFLNLNTFKYFWEILNNKSECFADDGIAINSGFINDLKTPGAKEKIINWLEQNNLGKKTINYKLRDWVFSRQRYWGEPIPLVYCEHCKNKKYNYILLHGYGSNSQDNFYPWLKTELEKQGHQVYCPDLPNTENPNIDDNVKYILANAKINADTIIVGHSLGGTLILKLLEKIKVKTHQAVLIDPPLRPEFNDKRRPGLEQSCDWKFDFKKIATKAKAFIILGDNSFSTIPEKQLQEVKASLGAALILTNPEAKHFKATEEPTVLSALEQTGWIPVPAEKLPVELPNVEKYEPTDTGESPLAVIADWVNTVCPRCGGAAKRETDTMPNWAGSSWYFIRYLDPKNTKAFADKEKMKYFLPIDWYNGGMEHTTLHLLYSRFWYKFLYDIGEIPAECGSEPYNKRTSHGMILGEGGEKMSKSKGNVVNPDDVIREYGADTLRLYEMFMGPFDQAIPWDVQGVKGVRRFLEKIWALAEKVNGDKSSLAMQTLLHKTIKKVTEDISEMRFNTAISAMMILVNAMSDEKNINQNDYRLFLKILAPFAPHITEELWHNFGEEKTIHLSDWPEFDPRLIIDEEIILAVQVNGKIRDEIKVAAEISEEELKKLVLSAEKIVKWVEGKKIKKFIYVKGKLVSIVV